MKEMLLDIKEMLLNTLILVTFLVGLIGFIVGITNFYRLSEGCRYQSLISRINLPYIVGCELARPRFEPLQK